jgi:hypothetical protein
MRRSYSEWISKKLFSGNSMKSNFLFLLLISLLKARIYGMIRPIKISDLIFISEMEGMLKGEGSC